MELVRKIERWFKPLSLVGEVKEHPSGDVSKVLLLDVGHNTVFRGQSGIERVATGIVKEFYRHVRSDVLVVETSIEPRIIPLFHFSPWPRKWHISKSDLIVHRPPVVLLCVYLRMGKPLKNLRKLTNGHVDENYFIVYDLLPIFHPGWYDDDTRRYSEPWLRVVASEATGLICISKCVADDLLEWLNTSSIERKEPLKIGYFHLGSDLPPPSKNVDDGKRELPLALRAPAALMVGSVEGREDRKGYHQALDAFELLWDAGVQNNLIIVGKRVAGSDALSERMLSHKYFGKRLFWEQALSDDGLNEYYRNATLFLYASHGEGFGLPLVEAAHHGLPLLLRDLPIFMELAGDHARYFTGFSGGQLAESLNESFKSIDAGTFPNSRMMPVQTWGESCAQLSSVIFLNNWYREWR